MKLRPNSIVQELVDAFQTARPVILQLGHDAKALEERGVLGNKRKIEHTDFEEDEEDEEDGKANSGRRSTTSQRQRHSTFDEVSTAQATNDDEDNNFQPGKARYCPGLRVANAFIDDGLISCPICNARMKEEAVFLHLDVHNKPEPISQAQVQKARFAASIRLLVTMLMELGNLLRSTWFRGPPSRRRQWNVYLN